MYHCEIETEISNELYEVVNYNLIGLVSVFNCIQTFVDYSLLKPSL